MKSLRIQARLRNGTKVVTTTPASVNPVQAGYEFRKAVLMAANRELTTVMWDSLKAETVNG